MADGPFDLGGLTSTGLAKRVWAEISDDEVWDAAAQLGYYFMLAMFPLIIFLLSFVALLPNVDLVRPFMATLAGVMPSQAYALIGREIERVLASSGGGLLTFGMLGTIWAASSGVASLMGTLNRAYEAHETRGFIKLRIVAIGLTFVLVVLLLAGSLLLVMGDSIATWAAGVLGLATVTRIVGIVVNYALGLAILFVALEVVYYFGPNVGDQKWRWVSPGSIVGVGLFVLSSLGFSLYVRLNDSYSVTYGSIGAVIVLMLWLYLLGLSIVLGAEVNSEIARAAARRGEADAPTSHTDLAETDDAARSVGAPPVDRPSTTISSRNAPAERLALRDLLVAAGHGNARVRAGAAAALGNFGPGHGDALAALERMLRDDDARVRESAARTLERVRRAA